MELAQYCPIFGYYERTQESPGRRGDYYTSVSVGPLFGELLADRFAKWLARMPAGRRQILEAGALTIGQLARGHPAPTARRRRPRCSNRSEYWILEPSGVRQQSQADTLKEFESRVRWFDSWNALPASGVNGVIFSNELLDAMPVHRLGWDAAGRKWFEWGVAREAQDFVWRKLPKIEAGVSVPSLPDKLLDVLPDGFTTEVCPAALDWWRNAARSLRAGKLLAFDYGLEAERFFAPERKDGTLRAYYRHHPAQDVLARAGEQDLTASANFTAIRDAGESAGLTTETFETQAQYLTGIVAQHAEDANFQEMVFRQVRGNSRPSRTRNIWGNPSACSCKRGKSGQSFFACSS